MRALSGYFRRRRSALLLVRLGLWSIPVALIFRLIGRQIFYLTAEDLVRKPRIREALTALGIRWFDYMSFDKVDPAHVVRLRGELADLLINKINYNTLNAMKPLFTSDAIDKDNITPNKIRICLFAEIINRLQETCQLEAASFCLTERYNRIYVYATINPIAIYLRQINKIEYNYSILSIACNLISFLNNILTLSSKAAVYLTKKYLITTKKRITGTSACEKPVDNAVPRIIFFPHKGINYGSLFRKDYYYQSEFDSPLYQKNIDHVEFEKLTEDIRESYQSEGVSVKELLPSGKAMSSIIQFVKHIVSGDVLHCQPLWQWFLLLPAFMAVYRRYVGYQRSIEWAPGSTALIGYEILFPLPLALALQSKGITLVALQERMQSAFYPGTALILDHYMVAGRKVADHIRQNTHCEIGNIYPIGQIRSDYLARRVSDVYKFNTARHKRKKVLVLDFISPINWWENTDPIVNQTANKQFYLDIINLSLDMPYVNFIIRGKNADWLSDPFFHEVVYRIGLANNLMVDTRYDQFDRSYLLADEADCIVAKHTSLGDECLSVNKPVIFHDWSPNSIGYSASICDYDGLPVFAFNYSCLLERLQSALDNKSDNHSEYYLKVLREIFELPQDGKSVGSIARDIVFRITKLL